MAQVQEGVMNQQMQAAYLDATESAHWWTKLFGERCHVEEQGDYFLVRCRERDNLIIERHRLRPSECKTCRECST
jgi:hypothetical protein